MRDGSFPLSHAICRSTRIRTGVNFSSPLCKSGMFYHYTMDLLRKENLRRVYFEQILKISEVTLSNYYSFCRRDWNRTSIFTYQLPVAILSGLRVTRRFCSPGRLRSCFLRVNSTLLATELLRNNSLFCGPGG